MSIEERLARVEARLQQLADEQAVAQLVAAYGPLVDAGDAERVAALWAEDGSYDVEGWSMTSRADVAAMVSSPAHQGLVAAGCSHFLGPAHVTVEGDRATAVCESVLLVRQAERILVARIGANHFDLVRTAAGGLVQRRTTRGLDGSDSAHALLRALGQV